MAAVIELRTAHDLDHSVAPRLRLLEGGRNSTARHVQRVYVLRRLVAVTVAAFVLLVFAQLVGAGFSGAGPAVAGSDARIGATHVVRPGDTLWSLASGVDPDADPRDVVASIMTLNEDISAGSLRPGQEIRLPGPG